MGRGSSKVGGVGNSSENLYRGLYVEGTPGEYQTQADAVVKGVRDVLSDFGFGDELRGVYFSEKGTLNGGEADASMNGLGDLHISTKYLQRGENTKAEGYSTSDTFYGTGAHEAGHAVVKGLLSKNPIEGDAKSDNLKRATARAKGKLEHEIIKEAKSRYGSNPPISKYGSKSEIEKVAEAVSDVYTNKRNANAYSKVIVDVMKDINKGTFKPKLKVSRREMGI